MRSCRPGDSATITSALAGEQSAAWLLRGSSDLGPRIFFPLKESLESEICFKILLKKPIGVGRKADKTKTGRLLITVKDECGTGGGGGGITLLFLLRILEISHNING